MPSLPPCDVELFGRRYAAPIGIAPMGGPAIVWPGADLHLARAAQRARIPYTLGMAGGATIEEIAEVAPDVCWFQLYRAARNDHAIGFDLVRRAAATDCQALVLTLDVPVRTTRAREVVVGLGGAFRPDLAMMTQMAMSPGWTYGACGRTAFRVLRRLRSYAGDNASINDVIAFARREMGGAFTWEEVAKYRDRWQKTLIVKGILHPQDAEKAVALGVDGMFVSNHGGRQIEALPAAIDALPAIVRASRQARDRDDGFRHPQRHRCGARLCARRRRRVCRQGLPVGSWRARRRRARATSSIFSSRRRKRRSANWARIRRTRRARS